MAWDESDQSVLERLAAKVAAIAADDLPSFCDSYLWMCTQFKKEALYFLRHKRYRCANQTEAEERVYKNKEFMRLYMEGLLVSQLLWSNHAAAYLYFTKTVLPCLTDAFSYLEVGPGHGLYLSEAADHPSCRRAEGWDISDESLRQTQAALGRLGVAAPVSLRRQDIHTVPPIPHEERFDLIVICEVLEHLSTPHEALRALSHLLADDGLIYINVPINSPAPDHIFLLRTPDEVRDMVESSGFEIMDFHQAPMTGYDAERALAEEVTINCFVLGRRPKPSLEIAE